MKSGTLISKTIALLLVALVAVLIYVLALAPALERYERQKGRIAVLATRVAMLTAEPSDAPDLHRQIEAVRTNARGLSPFWQGATNAAVTAGLVEQLSRVVNGASAQLESTEVLPPQTVDSVQTVGVRLRFQGSIDEIQPVLHALETDMPPLLLNRVSIRALSAPADAPARLAVEVEAYGLTDVKAPREPLS